LDFSQAEKIPTAFAYLEPDAKYNAKTFDNSNKMKARRTILINIRVRNVRTRFGSRKNSKRRKMPENACVRKMPQNPTRQVHALLGGIFHI
jgi:hypothetical protein